MTPDYAFACNVLLGMNLHYIGENKRAIEFYRNAIHIAETSSMIFWRQETIAPCLHHNMSMTYERMGDIRQAVENEFMAGLWDPNRRKDFPKSLNRLGLLTRCDTWTGIPLLGDSIFVYAFCDFDSDPVVALPMNLVKWADSVGFKVPVMDGFPEGLSKDSVKSMKITQLPQGTLLGW